MDSKISALLPILRKASSAILEVYQNESLFQIETKSDQSPLTEADRRSNEIIIEELNKIYPGIPVISEERKQLEYAERKKYDQYFLIDPLDGTKEFINRNGEFTINIAFIDGTSPSEGYVYVPVSNLAYIAIKGNGAVRIDQNNRRENIKSKPFFLHDPGITVVASRSHRDADTDRIIANLNHPEILSTGSSLKFLKIAEGKAHFYPRPGPTMEWDTAAAQCVLEESGGSVLRFDNLMPLEYTKENLLNPFFLAFGALLDPELLQDILTIEA